MTGLRRFRSPGLRARLAISIAALLVVVLAGTFVAVYRGVGADLRSRIDSDLSAEASGMEHAVARADRRGRDLESSARRYVRAQSFGPASRLLVVQLPGRPAVSNQPGLLEEGEAGGGEHGIQAVENAQVRGLLQMPEGFASLELEDVGELRLLTAVVRVDGRPVATVRAGEPVAPVERAQDGVSRTFLIAGSIALAAALAVGYAVAARTAAPLRRMARVAADVDAGDLTHRMGEPGPRDELHRLADSFDRMLDRLEDAFARQRSFVSDASHELRTPLTAIRGQLEVLAAQDAPDAAEVRRVEGIATREVQRMERLIEDLLTLARTDEGLALRIEAVDLGRFLREQVDAISPVTERRFEVEASGVRAAADPDRLAQVVRNLLQNAIAHTTTGGLVRATARADGSGVVVAVEDDGPGIPIADRERVFDRFHRLEGARDRATGGAGLGLAIARAIVEAHGGRIWAEESPAGGARVAFRLPLG